MQRHIKLGVSIIIPLFILMIPSNWIPIEQLSIVEHRVIAIFVLAALFWILEPICYFCISGAVLDFRANSDFRHIYSNHFFRIDNGFR
jgi:ACR3 family arsenite efflux pump ArsB